VTLWAFLLAALGVILCVVGANTSLGAKLGDQPAIGRGARLSAATGRLAVRTGVICLLLGGGLFVLGIVIHTLQLLLTLLFLVVIVVALVSAWGYLRRPRSHSRP
jgi:hypothetical protein